MPEWELNPFESAGDNSLEVQLEQLEQEIGAGINRQRYLLEEWARIVMEITKRENS